MVGCVHARSVKHKKGWEITVQHYPVRSVVYIARALVVRLGGFAPARPITREYKVVYMTIYTEYL